MAIFPERYLLSRQKWDNTERWCPSLDQSTALPHCSSAERTESTFYPSLRSTYLFFFCYFSVCQFSWVLIMSAVVNSAYSPQDQGLRAQLYTEGHSDETAEKRRMSPALENISSWSFLTRCWEEKRIWRSVCSSLSILSVCPSLLWRSASESGSPKYPPLKPFIILVNPFCTCPV